MTANTKATLATVGVGSLFVLGAVRIDLLLLLMLLFTIGLILGVAWFIFKDAFDDSPKS